VPEWMMTLEQSEEAPAGHTTRMIIVIS
jgi:hypothetical protein